MFTLVYSTPSSGFHIGYEEAKWLNNSGFHQGIWLGLGDLNLRPAYARHWQTPVWWQAMSEWQRQHVVSDCFRLLLPTDTSTSMDGSLKVNYRQATGKRQTSKSVRELSGLCKVVFTAQCYASAVLAVVMSLCVCRSLTNRYCIKMAIDRITQTTHTIA